MNRKEIVKQSLIQNTSNDPKKFKAIIRDYLRQAHSSGYDTEKLVNNAKNLDDNWLEKVLNGNDSNESKAHKIIKKLENNYTSQNTKTSNNRTSHTNYTPPQVIANNSNTINQTNNTNYIKYLIASVAIIILIVGIIFIFKNLNTNVAVNKVETSPIEISLNDKILKQLGYKNKNEITSIEIPETFKYKNKYYKITKIEDNAFKDCEYLSEITIPNSIIKIGNSAFENCLSLKKITIPNGIKEIGDSAFSGCLSLEDVIIPESVTIIRNNAFNNCLSLSNLKVPNNVVKIGENVFIGVRNIEYSGVATGSPWGAKSINGIAVNSNTQIEKTTNENKTASQNSQIQHKKETTKFIDRYFNYNCWNYKWGWNWVFLIIGIIFVIGSLELISNEYSSEHGIAIFFAFIQSICLFFIISNIFNILFNWHGWTVWGILIAILLIINIAIWVQDDNYGKPLTILLILSVLTTLFIIPQLLQSCNYAPIWNWIFIIIGIIFSVSSSLHINDRYSSEHGTVIFISLLQSICLFFTISSLFNFIFNWHGCLISGIIITILTIINIAILVMEYDYEKPLAILLSLTIIMIFFTFLMCLLETKNTNNYVIQYWKNIFLSFIFIGTIFSIFDAIFIKYELKERGFAIILSLLQSICLFLVISGLFKFVFNYQGWLIWGITITIVAIINISICLLDDYDYRKPFILLLVLTILIILFLIIILHSWLILGIAILAIIIISICLLDDYDYRKPFILLLVLTILILLILLFCLGL